MKKCYVHLERLPDHVIKEYLEKYDLKYEIKIEEHNDLNDDIYRDKVSQSLITILQF